MQWRHFSQSLGGGLTFPTLESLLLWCVICNKHRYGMGSGNARLLYYRTNIANSYRYSVTVNGCTTITMSDMSAVFKYHIIHMVKNKSVCHSHSSSGYWRVHSLAKSSTKSSNVRDFTNNRSTAISIRWLRRSSLVAIAVKSNASAKRHCFLQYCRTCFVLPCTL